MSEVPRAVIKQACEELHPPFYEFGFFVDYVGWYCDGTKSRRDDMNQMLEEWVQSLSPNATTSESIEQGPYNAISATSTKASTGSFQFKDSRPTFTTEGETIVRYNMSIQAMIGISVLLGLHLIGLCLFAA